MNILTFPNNYAGDDSQALQAKLFLLPSKIQPLECFNSTLSRPRLVQEIEQGLKQRIVIIQSSAGYGKTTLVQQWACSSKRVAQAWYALDGEDNDPTLFCAYLIASIAKVFPLSAELISAGRNGLASSQLLIKQLAAELQYYEQKTVLIFDDFHLINNEQVLQLLHTLISTSPIWIKLLFTTRKPMQAELSRCLLANPCHYIKRGQLALSNEETRHYLELALDFSLSEPELLQIQNTVEGWIAGLKLLILSSYNHEDLRLRLQQASLQVIELSHYLTFELLIGLPEKIQIFISKVVVVDRFDQALALTLSPESNFYYCVDYFKRHQLFLIELDEQGQWFRFHHLISDYFRQLLKQEQTMQWQDLNTRAARYFFNNRQYNEAVYHCEHSASPSLAMELLSHYERLSDLGLIALLRRLYLLVPAETLASQLPLLLDACLLEILRGDLHQAKNQLQQCQTLLATHNEDAKMSGKYHALLSQYQLIKTEYQQAKDSSELALSLLTEDDATYSLARLVLGAALYDLGEINPAITCFKQQLPILIAQQRYEGCIWAYAYLAHLLMVKGLLSEAAETLNQGLDYAAQHNLEYSDNMFFLHLFGAHIYLNRFQIAKAEQSASVLAKIIEPLGDYYQIQVKLLHYAIHELKDECQQAAALIPELEKLRNMAGRTGLNIHVDDALTRYWLKHKHYKKLGAWQCENISVEGRGEKYPTLLRAQARAQWALNNKAEAMAIFHLAITEAQALNLATEELRSLEAMVQLLASENIAKALCYLKQLLEKSAELNSITGFLYAKEIYLPLLQQLLPQLLGPAKQLGLQLLPLLTQRKNVFSSSLIPDPALLTGISAKEWQVLTKISQGLSNEQIIDAMHISINTLKSHINRAYRKLNVKHRQQAIDLVLSLQQAHKI